jgi:hypothetical protein
MRGCGSAAYAPAPGRVGTSPSLCAFSFCLRSLASAFLSTFFVSRLSRHHLSKCDSRAALMITNIDNHGKDLHGPTHPSNAAFKSSSSTASASVFFLPLLAFFFAGAPPGRLLFALPAFFRVCFSFCWFLAFVCASAPVRPKPIFFKRPIAKYSTNRHKKNEVHVSLGSVPCVRPCLSVSEIDGRLARATGLFFFSCTFGISISSASPMSTFITDPG